MSAKPVVVDDHLLLRMLLDDEPPGLRPGASHVFTTGLWYHRLCRSLMNDAVAGIFSRSIGSADSAVATATIAAIAALPETVGLVSFRQLAWPMARLVGAGVRLNLLSLEALAATEHLQAELCLARADRNPPLLAAAKVRGVPARVVSG
jgi:hypothetical protein